MKYCSDKIHLSIAKGSQKLPAGTSGKDTKWIESVLMVEVWDSERNFDLLINVR